MPNGADHDLLTKIDVKLTHLCQDVRDINEKDIVELKNSIGDIYEKINDQKGICGKRVEECSKYFTPNHTFRWLFGILVTVMLIVGGVVIDTNIRVTENTTKIEQHFKYSKEKVKPAIEDLENAPSDYSR
jgi:hypothetical protein